MGGSHTLETSYRNLYATGEWRTRPLTVVMAMSNSFAFGGSNVVLIAQRNQQIPPRRQRQLRSVHYRTEGRSQT